MDRSRTETDTGGGGDKGVLGLDSGGGQVGEQTKGVC